MEKFNMVVAVFAVLLVYIAKSTTDGSDSAKSKPFLVDGKDVNRRSTDLETSVGHADNKDEERLKLTGRKTYVEINDHAKNPGGDLDGKDRSTVEKTSTNSKTYKNGKSSNNRRSKNRRRSKGKAIQKRPIGYYWFRSQRRSRSRG